MYDQQQLNIFKVLTMGFSIPKFHDKTKLWNWTYV